MSTTAAAGGRVVVKVGSSSLTGAPGAAGGVAGLDPGRVDGLVDALAAAHRSGREVVLVSSGAIASGLGPLDLARRVC